MQAGVDAENQIEVAIADSDWREGTGASTGPSANGNRVQYNNEVVWSNQPQILSSADETVLSDVFATEESPIEIQIDVTDMVKSYIADNPGETEITFALCEMNGNRIHIGSKEGGISSVALLDVRYEGQEEEEAAAEKAARVEQIKETLTKVAIIAVPVIVVIAAVIIIIVVIKKHKKANKS